ncbi:MULTISPECIES: M1 family metallopeptidase [Catenuloplanes]|uniref:Aminopeptidase N n=1 Tax=Catenuloplanes niger TaxID=587534 RepID=A0AAE3ZVB9_9ACTN|nr:M1 family metallopeptidase [Catenuloplanes niger]MDR7325652.1 aminopeptidase N [Catenuloplanes niger]
MLRRTVLTAAAVLAVVLGVQSGAQAAPAPGAPGVGDSYYPDYGNGGYDVGHYDIRLRYHPETDRLTGTTTILATATQDLSAFNLDFALRTTSVRVDNRPATFAREGDHELVVTPARPLTAGRPTTIVVTYDDVPSSVVAAGYTAWNRTPDGALAVGQPEIAWWWYPSNDHPTDKATFDVSVLVPSGVEAISNGSPTRWAQPELRGWDRWSWRSAAPQATYLAFLAIGDFETYGDETPDGEPIITAYSTRLDPVSAAAARGSIERTSEIIDWQAGLFGPYPFGARGGVVTGPRELGFALETQTRPVYDGVAFARGSNNSLVVHELAHQWFGDSVSVRDWRDIWLNEGFASYAEWLWSEKEGEGTAAEIADYVHGVAWPADDPFWQVLPGDPGAARLFHPAVYDRGALTLHALREAVGDEDFFAVLRAWAQTHRYRDASTAEFVALAEEISGDDLGDLFRTWLYTPGRPELEVAARTVPAEPRSWARITAAHEEAHRH